MKTTDQLRRQFLDFFKRKGHTIVPSDSLVPKDDPTLLFTGAGMNQFKDKFLGRNVTYRRATSSQKCLRTGDLDNVGRTSGHHTFFEMLGNFSFGDYFKKEAISWAWEFFTKELKIPQDRLWVSVYKDDAEAYDIWKDVIKVPPDRIIKFGEKENFWPSEAPTKGPNGPCGPCSEIFYDYGKDIGCKKPGCTPECDCGRFVEVWNLVFTQFDRQPDGSLKALPSKNIDTGMGLERLASVMQGVKTNFEIDIFRPLIAEIDKNSLRTTKDERRKTKACAIADHIRAVTFTISDGVMPSNEERGYVVRKLIRRAMKHCQDIGIIEPFLYKLVAAVVEAMKEPYPELKAKRDDIAQVVKREEENFLFVIETQVPKVEEAFEKIKKEKTDAKLADIAFNFYDTYGMPYDMLEDIAEKHGLKIDKDKFEALLEKQRQASRQKTKIKGEIFSETFAKSVESLGLKTEFLGYEKSHAEAKVIAVLDGGEVVLDRTPFYGESGGQVGDWGTIETPSGKMEVEDAKKIGDTIVHIGRILNGKIAKGETAKVFIDDEVRKEIMANHTATHLLQAALRKVLGEHVRQTGSLVADDHLRFDFTHMKKMDETEVARVEELVNENISKGIKVAKKIEDLESAKKEGATALFGEKYDKRVRVISIGDVSKELCGGTHVDNTKEIGIFRITGESSIASGVRRIEAVTGEKAKEWIARKKTEEASRLKAEAAKEEEKRLMGERIRQESANIDSYIARAKAFGNSKVITEIIDNFNMEGLRYLSDRIKEKEKSAVIILATLRRGTRPKAASLAQGRPEQGFRQARAASRDDEELEKVSFVISVADDIIKKNLKAGDIAKELAGLVDGSGGGRPNFAQGGGRSSAKLEAALAKIVGMIEEKIV